MHTFTTTDLDLTDDPKVTSVKAVHIRVTSATNDATVNIRNGSSTGAIGIPVFVSPASSVHILIDPPQIFPGGVFVETDADVEAGTIVPG